MSILGMPTALDCYCGHPRLSHYDDSQKGGFASGLCSRIGCVCDGFNTFKDIITKPESGHMPPLAQGQLPNPVVRTFETGANRGMDTEKFDYEGFLSPLTLRRFAEYMHKNRHLPDGTLRDSDNWQQGIPLESYMKSAWRHFIQWWGLHRGRRPQRNTEDIEEALCGVIFNASGFLHEILKEKE